MSEKIKRALFIYLQPWFSVPMLISLVKMMAASGWKVTIITLKSENSPFDADFHRNIDIYSIHGSYGKSLAPLLYSSSSCILKLLKIMGQQNYDVIFGVAPNSLFMAQTLGAILRKPTIYISLELYFRDELQSGLWRLYKNLERWCSRRCLLALSQDPWRCNLLSWENGLSQERVMSLPNTDLGGADLEDSKFLHTKLGLPEDKVIILHPGYYMLHQVIDRLGEVAQAWPDEWRIVFHKGYYVSYQKKDLESRNKHIIFSKVPFPYNQLKEVFSSATIGFVWHYNSERPGGGKNQDYIGYSSGKFNLFTKYGKPVITSNQTTFREIFNEYQCGIAISSLDEMGAAISKILMDIDSYRSEAKRFYEERLRFDQYYKKFSEKLESLME
jgi:glycosyltransferase involved in cell wall biosynthesis